jgi:DNA-binding NarL/FixJ family response regulator
MTLRILLVDDNQTFLLAVRQFLDLLPGMTVIAEAHDGIDALSQAAELAPDLILLDIAMPGMNGLDVARHIQLWPQPPEIVFLSMHDNAAYREAALELGARGYVGKADFVAALLPILEQLACGQAQTGRAA